MSDLPSILKGVPDLTFYFTNITFQVEGILFRVPGHHFIQQSEVFRDMFKLPIAADTAPDGLSDEQPLRLEGVKETDFRQLLRVMFPSYLLYTDTFTVQQWISVLRLSAMWQMEYLKRGVLAALPRLSGSREDWTALLDLSVEHQLPEARAIAIQQISATFHPTPNFFDMIAMARKYRVKSWFETGVQGLVQRKELLSEADAKNLGWKTAFRLCRLREDRHHRPYGSPVNLENEFKDEVKYMDN